MRVEFIRPAPPESGPASGDEGRGPGSTASEESGPGPEDQPAGESRPSG